MNRTRRMKKLTAVLATALAGGTMLQNGCTNILLGLTPCGTVLAFCEPGDQALLLFRYFEIPDYRTDPTCTIPFACGGDDNNLFPPPIGGDGGGVQVGGGGGLGGGGGGGGFGGGGGI